MMYDNAQLARVYLHAYQITGNESLFPPFGKSCVQQVIYRPSI
jgi:uncharacterized protein YyaL (SSP411 family)